MAATSPPLGAGVAAGRGLRADSEDSDFGADALSEDEYVTRRLQKIMGAASSERIDELADASAGAAGSGGGVTQSARTALSRLQALSLEAPLSAMAPAAANDALGGEADAATLSLPASFFDDDGDDDGDQDDAYVITWEGGQLGLLFKASPAQQVVIRRVNKQGTALGLHLARAGDVLVGLNGISVQGVPFLEIIEQLKNPRFPIKLEFEPIKFGALPFGLASVGGAPATALPPPPPYAAFSSAPPLPPPQMAQMASPTSSAGTVEVMDCDSSFVMVPRPQAQMGEPSASRMADGSRPEYDVVWDEGPLGCGLKHRNGFPTVKTMSTAGVSASVAQIGAGDVLTVINGYKTHEIGFKSAITMLQRAPKPIYLRFRRQPQTQPQALAPSGAASAVPRDPAAATLAPFQYSVLWADGPLGIQIKAGGGDGRVYVSRLTGAGNPVMTAQIAPGDVFVRIADVDVASRGIAGAFELLKSVQKPVLLVFEKPAKSTEGGGGAAPLPSFRRLREEAAAREKMAAHDGHPHGLMRTQSAGSRGNGRHLLPPHAGGFDGDDSSWQTRTAPYPSSAATADATTRMQPPAGASTRSLDLKFDFDDRSEAGSQQSNARTERSQPQGGVAVDDDASSDLPRFSDIEAGRVAVTPEMAALPPPPSYLDMFTQSGRSLDTFHSTRAAPGSPLHSDSVSMSSEQHSDRFAAQPPPMPMPMPMHSSAPQLGYALAPPPLESDAFVALPPPPQYASFFPPPPDGSSRLEELRQQYIEAQRAHNHPQFSNTMMSSYSDLDDSGVMRERPFPTASRAPPMAPLPLPELWVRWSDGPLGITFKRKNGRIVVSRLTGAGLSPGLEQLRTGDWLVSFNRQSTETLRLSETMELLKRLPKPIDMRFVVQ